MVFGGPRNSNLQFFVDEVTEEHVSEDSGVQREELNTVVIKYGKYPEYNRINTHRLVDVESLAFHNKNPIAQVSNSLVEVEGGVGPKNECKMFILLEINTKNILT